MHRSTIERYRKIAERYNALIKLEGMKSKYMSQSYYYDIIEVEMGVCRRTITRAITMFIKGKLDR